MKRRRAILDAARSLFSRYGGDNISAEQIAAAADVSPPTLYNLIGTRDQLLATLLDELLGTVAAELAELSVANPLDRGAATIDICARRFIDDAAVFRYVVRKLVGLERVSDVRMKHDAVIMQHALMDEAIAIGLIDARWDAYQIALEIYLSFTGALMLWAGQMLDDEHFCNQVQFGYWSILAGVASAEGRAVIADHLAEVQRKLRLNHPVVLSTDG